MPLMIAPQGINLSIKRVMGNDKVRRYLEALGLVPNQSIQIRSRFLSCRKSLRSLLFDLSDRKQIAAFEAISSSFVILIRLGNNGKKRGKRSRSAGWLQSYASVREVDFLTFLVDKKGIDRIPTPLIVLKSASFVYLIGHTKRAFLYRKTLLEFELVKNLDAGITAVDRKDDTSDIGRLFGT